ncbi:choice-of-anchor L domain-containing protein [uncultured Dokdonia sp.]|uniref:choice-of-anchor L domain-containing protein n=1 Tax=uncultured Dokdonia sp. TaxID=575653 RepID=UPI00260A2DAB|nr:choice-of-anchor L domain-containing protein [uncultured Dokdonia sp.]
MKKLLLFILICTTATSFSQITVDDSMTPQQLIEAIFLDGSVVEVTNIQSQSGSDFGNTTSIGSFSNANSDFPFSGVVLTTGNINQAPGPNLNIQSNGGWSGDIDLEIFTDTSNSNDASFLQFDFTPYVNQLNLNFVLASEEYDQNFECTFADSFAFILTDLNTGIAENIALIPGTETPISVINIHPEVPGLCPAVNETFFDRYNFSPFNDQNTAATNFNGQTVEIMVATELIVGHEYTIKLVIADNADTIFDSAIFLASESFGFQLDLGMDRMVSNGNAPCGNSIETLGIPEDDTASYQWFEFNTTTSTYDPISGETNSLLDVTTSGDYRLEVTAANNNVLMDEVTVEFEGDFGLGTPEDLFIDEGDQDGLAIFDLTVNIPMILNGEDPTDFTISYYETQQDAEAQVNAIAMPNAYQNIANPQTIYVRTMNSTTGCRAISNFIIETDALSLDSPDSSLFSIYPNPTSDIVTINLRYPNELVTIAIIDIQGKILREETIQASQNINLQELSKGVYFMQARTSTSITTVRLIKK